MRHKIVIGVLTGILALALMMLAVPFGLWPAIASPLGSEEISFNANMWEFEASITGCGNWRDGSDYLTWQEATKLTPISPECVWHSTDLQNITAAWFGYIANTQVGYPDSGHPFASVNKVLMSWDTSGLPDNAEIKSAKLRLYVLGAVSYGGWEFNVNFYKFHGTRDGSYNWLNDKAEYYNFDQDYLGAQSMVFEDMPTGGWVEIPLNARGLAEIHNDGYTVMWARSVVEAISYEPSWIDVACASYISVDTSYGGGEEPQLVVEYVTPISPRVVTAVDNEAPGGAGDDLTDIIWLTPRCAFDDEEVKVQVNGEAGCPFILKATNGSQVIDTVTDAIKSDGKFQYKFNLAGYAGKFRIEAKETTTGHTDTIVSTWGWSEQFVDAGSCKTWAKYLEEESASWRRAEKDYRIASETEVLKFYWLSNMLEAEIPDCELDIRQAGATQQSVYNSTLADLLDDYYECEESDNDNLVSSRYILASMGDVADDLDGLIIDLDIALVNSAKGIYYANISQLEEYKLEAISGYLYMGIGELKITEEYIGFGDYNVQIVNDINIGFQANLSEITVEVKEGDQVRQTTLEVLDSSNKVVTSHWLGEGDWSLLLTLGESGENFEYKRLWDATQGPGGEEGGGGGGGLPGGVDDIWDWLTEGVGRWVLLILCISLEALIFHKHKEVVVILACCLLAVWIVLEWVDLWLVVLLALGAGLSVWAMLRRKTQGGNE